MLDRMYEDLDLGVTYRETERPQSFHNQSNALIERLKAVRNHTPTPPVVN